MLALMPQRRSFTSNAEEKDFVTAGPRPSPETVAHRKINV